MQAIERFIEWSRLSEAPNLLLISKNEEPDFTTKRFCSLIHRILGESLDAEQNALYIDKKAISVLSSLGDSLDEAKKEKLLAIAKVLRTTRQILSHVEEKRKSASLLADQACLSSLKKTLTLLHKTDFASYMEFELLPSAYDILLFDSSLLKGLPQEKLLLLLRYVQKTDVIQKNVSKSFELQHAILFELSSQNHHTVLEECERISALDIGLSLIRSYPEELKKAPRSCQECLFQYAKKKASSEKEEDSYDLLNFLGQGLFLNTLPAKTRQDLAWRAIDLCHEEGLLGLVESGININDVQEMNLVIQKPLLHAVVERGMIKALKKLIEKDVLLNARNEFNMTALHKAFMRGNIEAAQILLSAGDPIAKDDRGCTPLQRLLKYPREELCSEENKKLFLEAILTGKNSPQLPYSVRKELKKRIPSSITYDPAIALFLMHDEELLKLFSSSSSRDDVFQAAHSILEHFPKAKIWGFVLQDAKLSKEHFKIDCFEDPPSDIPEKVFLENPSKEAPFHPILEDFLLLFDEWEASIYPEKYDDLLLFAIDMDIPLPEDFIKTIEGLFEEFGKVDTLKEADRTHTLLSIEKKNVRLTTIIKKEMRDYLKHTIETLERDALSPNSLKRELLHELSEELSSISKKERRKPNKEIFQLLHRSITLHKTSLYEILDLFDLWESSEYEQKKQDKENLQKEIKEKTLRQSLLSFITNIEHRSLEIDTPKKLFQATEFYQNIKRELCHVIAKTKKSICEERENGKGYSSKTIHLLFRIIQAAIVTEEHCGGAYHRIALELYMEICHKKPIDTISRLYEVFAESRKLALDAALESVSFEMSRRDCSSPINQEMRLSDLRSVKSSHLSHNTNGMNKALAVLGEEYKIPGYKSHMEEQYSFGFHEELVRKAFLDFYNPVTLAENFFLELGKSTETKDYLDFFTNNIPPWWRDDLLKLSQKITKGTLSNEDISKLLLAHGILLTPGKTALEAIQEERIYSFLATYVQSDTTGVFKIEGLVYFLEKMGIITLPNRWRESSFKLW